MGWQRATFPEVKDKILAGDVIAFSGKNQFSDVIKRITRSAVTHVGLVLPAAVESSDTEQQIIEATYSNGVSGVMISPLMARIDGYDGTIWWLPLHDQARQRLDLVKFVDFLRAQHHKPYDVSQMFNSAVDVLDNVKICGQITRNNEDFSGFFCSEIVAAGLEAGGIVSRLNASEVTPADLCCFNIFQENYYQLKGRKRMIPRYNFRSPEDWGEA